MEPRVAPQADDEVVEIFDGEEPAPAADSWADLLPPTATPGDGAWAPPALASPVRPVAPPPVVPFDWAAVELPPPPVVAPPDEQIEVFDGAPEPEDQPVPAPHDEPLAAAPAPPPPPREEPPLDEPDAATAPAQREEAAAAEAPAAPPQEEPAPLATPAAVPLPAPPDEPVAVVKPPAVPLPAPPDEPVAVVKPPAVPLPAPPDEPVAAAKTAAPARSPVSVPPPERTPPPPPGSSFAADVPPEGSDVLSLFAPPSAAVPAEPPGRDTDRLVAGARDLFALGDFTGALELLREAVALDPQHGAAVALLARTEDTLVQMYESKLGRLSRTPRVLLQPDEIVWLNLDHRAGFILAQIDGRVTLEDIFALSGMSRLDTAKILVELIEQGAIAS